MTQVSVSGDYAAAIDFLYGRINYEQTADMPYRRHVNLEGMQQLLERLDNPQLRLPAIHIAGTKGKGSVAAMIGSVLTVAGYRTGSYTSPHLGSLEERYKLDGSCCSPDELVQLTESVRPAVEEMDRIAAASSSPRLTFFEITTAMAWLYFNHKAVDLVVLEVGLGGRLDSTNLCQPLVSVITSISFDHTKQLGNTLSAIAREKAGIIKRHVPVISGVVAPEARQVIAATAGERQAPLAEIGRHFAIANVSLNRHTNLVHENVEFDFQQQLDGKNLQLDRVQLGLLGRHQAMNGGVALAALDRLSRLGWDRVDESSIRRGLAAARCPARIEIVHRSPPVILDTAHNVASVQALVDALQAHFATNSRVLVFAASRDKDIAGMLRAVLPHFDHVVLTQFLTNPRAVSADALFPLATRIVQELGARRPSLAVAPTPSAAWRAVEPMLDAGNLVCVTGSFFLAAELRDLLPASLVAR